MWTISINARKRLLRYSSPVLAFTMRTCASKPAGTAARLSGAAITTACVACGGTGLAPDLAAPEILYEVIAHQIRRAKEVIAIVVLVTVEQLEAER